MLILGLSNDLSRYSDRYRWPKITLQQEPKRVVLQDGRDILTLALLDRENPFNRLVAWNNNLQKRTLRR